MAVRDDVKKALEQARADKKIGSSLEASVTLYCNAELYDFLNAIPMDELADLMIVSHIALEQGEGGVRGLVDGLGVQVDTAAGGKCLRLLEVPPRRGRGRPVPPLRPRAGQVIPARTFAFCFPDEQPVSLPDREAGVRLT